MEQPTKPKKFQNICQIQNILISAHRGVGRPATIPIKYAWLDQPSSYVSQFPKPKTTINELIICDITSKQISSELTNTNTAANAIEKTIAKKRGKPFGSKNKQK